LRTKQNIIYNSFYRLAVRDIHNSQLRATAHIWIVWFSLQIVEYVYPVFAKNTLINAPSLWKFKAPKIFHFVKVSSGNSKSLLQQYNFPYQFLNVHYNHRQHTMLLPVIHRDIYLTKKSKQHEQHILPDVTLILKRCFTINCRYICSAR